MIRKINPEYTFEFVLFSAFLLLFFGCRETPVQSPAEQNQPGQQSSITHLSGNISGTLTFAQGPYTVIDDIIVGPDQKLIVEPGVDIHFNKGKGLIVYGELIMIGGRYNTIRLNGDGQKWKGLKISGSKNCEFEYCIVEDCFNLVDSSSFQSVMTISNSSVKLTHIIFRNNVSLYGGALNLDSSSVMIKNCIFSGNYGSYYGGAILAHNSSFQIFNNTFVNNITDNYGAGIFSYNTLPSILQNNIFHDNLSKTGNTAIITPAEDSAAVDIRYNYISSSPMDPNFVSNDDFHLLPYSACKNAGNPDSAFRNYDGTRNDQGAYGGPLGNW